MIDLKSEEILEIKSIKVHFRIKSKGKLNDISWIVDIRPNCKIDARNCPQKTTRLTVNLSTAEFIV